MGVQARRTVTDDTSELKEVSWKDVAKHNTAESCWITVDDIAHDLTSWVHKHPGGSELMLTFAGREATHAFNSYHALSIERASEKLRCFRVAKVVDSEFQKYPAEDPFYAELTKDVKNYFAKNKVDPKDWRPGLWRFAVMLAVAAAALSVCWGVVEASWPMQVLAAVVFGWMQALPLLHIMHDCSHGAFSHSPLAWDVVGQGVMDLYAGASMTAWHLQHVVGHHVWTNVFETDPDMPPARQGDPRRLVDKQEWTSMYAYQHIYLPLAYGVLALKVRWTDVTHAWGPEMAGTMRVRKHTAMWKAQWIIVKALWVCWRWLVPLFVFKVPFFWLCTLFLVSDMITGWYLAFNFQVSHVSTEADYPFGHDDRPQDVCEDVWSVSQIKTSVDYSHGSWLMAWMCGALNYQTVHHLYPGISQYQYPAIAPIIRKKCAEHGIKYNHLPTFASAIWGHIAHLANMGRRGEKAHMHMG
ncbi:Delta(5) fatty acid desaturase A [Diplonema papillatum]|nr:Delta(5) fatty acid desaturase A [Diplonema papillatum]